MLGLLTPLEEISCIRLYIQEQACEPIFSRNRFSSWATRQSSTISVAQSSKTHQRQRLVPGGFDQKKVRQAIHSTLGNPLENNTNSKYKGCKHYYDVIYVVDMKGSQKKNFQVLQSHPRQGQSRYSSQDSRFDT